MAIAQSLDPGLGNSRVFLQRIDGDGKPVGEPITAEALREKGLYEVIDGQALKDYEKSFLSEHEGWVNRTLYVNEPISLDFTVTLDEKERQQLREFMDRIEMDELKWLAGVVRRAIHMPTLLFLYLPFSLDEYRRLSRLCHKHYRMNLTRFFRSRVPRWTALGVPVRLPSGSMVWRK